MPIHSWGSALKSDWSPVQFSANRRSKSNRDEIRDQAIGLAEKIVSMKYLSEDELLARIE